MKTKNKILVFGGSFNPPTISHKLLVEKAQEKINPELTIIVPASIHQMKLWKRKSLNLVFDDQQRLDMCDINFKTAMIDTYEIDQGNKEVKTYTYDTLNYISKKYPNHEIFFIVGEDKLNTLPRWIESDKLLKNFKFIVFSRENKNIKEQILNNESLSNFSENFIIIDEQIEVNVSSTMARDNILNNRSNNGVLTKDIIEYTLNKKGGK